MSPEHVQVAVVQLSSTADRAASVQAALEAIEEAAETGAQLVALPESVAAIGVEPASVAEPRDGPTFSALRESAMRHKIVLAAGTLFETSADPRRPFNTSVLYGPSGQELAVYRKIHLFDVNLGASEQSYRESDQITRGGHSVVAEVSGWKIGLSICYDLRFPKLFEQLRDRAPDIVLVPSAFTVPTGKDHWETLLRARAIEQQCYVIAAAQFGRHGPKRRSYGRSMIVDPWGTVMATVPDGDRLGTCTLRRSRLEEVRAKLPCHEHRKVAFRPCES